MEQKSTFDGYRSKGCYQTFHGSYLFSSVQSWHELLKGWVTSFEDALIKCLSTCLLFPRSISLAILFTTSCNRHRNLSMNANVMFTDVMDRMLFVFIYAAAAHLLPSFFFAGCRICPSPTVWKGFCTRVTRACLRLKQDVAKSKHVLISWKHFIMKSLLHRCGANGTHILCAVCNANCAREKSHKYVCSARSGQQTGVYIPN